MEIIKMDDKNNNDSGYLELISGPMFSGKTSKLLNLHKQFTICDIDMLVINHADDSMRYSTTKLSTHDQNMIPCIMADSLSNIINLTNNSDKINKQDNMNDSNKQITFGEFNKYKVILINEIQFFKNEALEWIKTAVDKYNKHVYVCGLDGDFQRNSFGNWLETLIPFCDNHIKLYSYCSNCKNKKAIFTYRKTDETAQKIIGSDCYIPVCRGCYIKLNKLN
jgi:thymidine kinase